MELSALKPSEHFLNRVGGAAEEELRIINKMQYTCSVCEHIVRFILGGLDFPSP